MLIRLIPGHRLREAKRRIQGMDLKKLAKAGEVIEDFINWGGSEKQVAELREIWVQKVLLLVTGIDDVLRMLQSTMNWPMALSSNGRTTHRLLTRRYAERTKSISSIVILLNHVHGSQWQAIRTMGGSLYQEILSLETFLVDRAMKLMSGGGYGLGNIVSLIEKIEDNVGDGSGSAPGEEIVVAMAVSRLMELEDVISFAAHLKSRRSVNRLYQVFVETRGLTSKMQVERLGEQLHAPYRGGDELAKAILQCVALRGLEISEAERTRLMSVAGLERVGLFSGLLGVALALEMLKDPLLDLRTRGELLIQMMHEFPDGIFFHGGFADEMLSADEAAAIPFCLACDQLKDCKNLQAVIARRRRR